MLFFFFFQAEDGIRDLTVTGVQTCALPISWQLGGYGTATPMRIALTDVRQVATRGFSSDRTVVLFIGLGAVEIGRASCRERSVDLGGRRIIKKKKIVA